METAGKTGIEISPGVSDATKATGKVLHALHLDWFGAAVGAAAKKATIVITVDGYRREEPFAGAHFVECAPGTHRLELEWNTHGIGGRSLAPLQQDILVEPGRITEAVYTVQTVTSHGPSAASLVIKGTRASAPGLPGGGSGPSAAARFGPGARVLVQWADGKRYPATVQQADAERCLVAFPDGRQEWIDTPYLSSES